MKKLRILLKMLLRKAYRMLKPLKPWEEEPTVKDSVKNSEVKITLSVTLKRGVKKTFSFLSEDEGSENDKYLMSNIVSVWYRQGFFMDSSEVIVPISDVTKVAILKRELA